MSLSLAIQLRCEWAGTRRRKSISRRATFSSMTL
jgi:hypothetical protein